MENSPEQYGGRIRHFAEHWRKYTTNSNILDIVQNCHIDFEDVPIQDHVPCQVPFNVHDKVQIEAELLNMKKAGIVETCRHEQGEYISPIFARKKKDDSLRIILNLKELNKSVEYHHFKMDNRNMAAQLMTKNCYMASIDLRQAYYLVPIAEEHKKYLRFMWKGQLMQFTCLPNGLACAPRLFTKLLKPVYSTLREEGISIVGYIDDTFLAVESEEACIKAVERTIELLTELGFIINMKKSVLKPTQQISYLGYVFDSRRMTISLGEDKREKMSETCRTIRMRAECKQSVKVRKVAELVGLMVAYNEGADMGPLHYRNLERDKIVALKQNKGNYDASMHISKAGLQDIVWWESHVYTVFKNVWRNVPTKVVSSDASLSGWGAECAGITTGGRWTPEEAQLHINVLELKAGLFALKSFGKRTSNTSVMLRMDNTTAVAYVNHMGGSRSKQCDDVAREIWAWARSKNIWIIASFIPGRVNTDPDYRSWNFDDNTEWTLEKKLFRSIAEAYGMPDVDLFASRLNHQIERYVAWEPDPMAMYIDAFSINWNIFDLFYAFPPFSLIDRCLQKTRQEQSTGILVVPAWPTRPWWTTLHSMLLGPPRVIAQAQRHLHLPNSQEKHKMRNLTLLACKLSGKCCKSSICPREQWKLL